MTMHTYYINGEFVTAEQAVLPANDLAVLRGYGAFDFLRTYGGHPFRLMDNIRRLRRSCDLIALEYPWSDDAIYDIVMQTLARNHNVESSIRIVITGGSSLDNILPQGEPSLIVMVAPLQPQPVWWYTQGVSVITDTTQRAIPGAKSINYIPAIIALKRARAAGAVEALYVDGRGCVSEGTTTNVFAFFGDTLVTPADDLLPGLTRALILELAAPVFDVQLRPLSRAELMQADEVFLTAANKRVVPVISVDGTPIGSGTPGQRTRVIMSLFDAQTQKIAAGVV